MYLHFVLAHVNELAMSLSGNIILKSSVTSLQELFEYFDMTTFSVHLTSAWRTDESINILSSVWEVPFRVAVGMESLLFWKWKSNDEDDGARSLCFFLSCGLSNYFLPYSIYQIFYNNSYILLMINFPHPFSASH